MTSAGKVVMENMCGNVHLPIFRPQEGVVPGEVCVRGMDFHHCCCEWRGRRKETAGHAVMLVSEELVEP